MPVASCLAWRWRAALLAGTALHALGAQPMAAHAQPAPDAHPLGGMVSFGSATISQGGTTTTITQTTPRAAINWQSFDVGAQQSVRFQQPGPSAIALNRVAAGNPSQMAGRIDANGQVILINPDGVTFFRGAQVNTAGLVVSAAGMSDANFAARHMVFDQPAHPGARIVNAGTLTVGQAGLAALVAPQVVNSGVIQARMGKVVLAGAVAHTLDLYGDGLLALDVNSQVRQAPGGGAALVTNTGTILAEGGTVQLTARAVDGVVQTLVQAGGTIAVATGPGGAGTVVLDGIGGNIAVTGQLLATGSGGARSGGRIVVAPSGTALIAAGALLDASGNGGGGTVSLGSGSAAAAGRLSRAVLVADGARLAADATGRGQGGRVTLRSSGETVLAGSATARGGAVGGDGGIVEVSGPAAGFTGTADVGAPAGRPGSVLLDPDTLEVAASLTSGINVSGSLGTPPGIGDTLTGHLDFVTPTALHGIGSGTIVLQAATLLDVASSVSLAPGVNLTLQSGRDLRINPGVTVSLPGTGVLTAQSGVVFSAVPSVGALGGVTVDGASLSAATIVLGAGSGGLQLGGVVLQAASLNASALGGGISQSLSPTFAVGSLSLSAVGVVALVNPHNAIGTLAGVNVPSGSVTLADTSALTVAGQATAGVGFTVGGGALATPPTLTIAGTIAAPQVVLAAGTGGLTVAGGSTLGQVHGGLDLSTTGSLTEASGAVFSATTLSSSGGVGGTALLAGTANAFADLGAFRVGGDLAVSDTFALTIVQSVTAKGSLTLGSLTPGGGTSGLSTPPGLTVAGTLAAPKMAVATGSDGITLGAGARLGQPSAVISLAVGGGAGEAADSAILAGTLSFQGPLGRSANLLATANAVGTLNGVTVASGGFRLVDSTGLTVAGGVTAAGNVFLDVASPGGTLQLGSGTAVANINAGAFGRVALVADVIAEPALGAIVAPAGTVQLASASTLDLSVGGNAPFALAPDLLAKVATATLELGGYNFPNTSSLRMTDRNIALAAPVTLAGGPTTELRLLAAGSIVQAGAAALQVGTLSVQAGGGATLTAPANGIAVLQDATAGGAGLTLADAGALTLAGTVAAPNVVLGTGGALALAPGATLSAGAGVVDLSVASGGVSADPSAVLQAGTLRSAGGVAGTFALTGSGVAIGTLGPFAVTGDLALADTTALTVAGPVTATGSVVLTGAPTLTLAGSLAAPSLALAAGTGGIALGAGAALGQPGATLALATPGQVTEADGALVSAGLLHGGGVLGAVFLTSSLNAVGTLADIRVATTLALTDSIPLTLAGTVAAPRIIIDAPHAPVILADGATLETDGTLVPAGFQPTAGSLPSAVTDGGAYVTTTSFTQYGTSMVASLGGTASILSIQDTGGGTIAFARSGGLVGPQTWLVLEGTQTGTTASGRIDVRSLTLYAASAGGLQASLSGTVDQFGGSAAASVATYANAAPSALLLNGCPVGEAECGIPPIAMQSFLFGSPVAVLPAPAAPGGAGGGGTASDGGTAAATGAEDILADGSGGGGAAGGEAAGGTDQLAAAIGEGGGSGSTQASDLLLPFGSPLSHIPLRPGAGGGGEDDVLPPIVPDRDY